MITNNGKVHVKRFLGGFVPNIAQSIAFGIGGGPESAGDGKLAFEVGRVDITLTSFDFVANRLVWKATVPEEFTGKIYEAAIYSVAADSVAGQYGSRLIASFDSVSEQWIDPTNGAPGNFYTENPYAGGSARIGVDSLRQTPAANATKVDAMNQLAMDLSGYSGNDTFVFAYHIGNANTTSVRFRFMTDGSNYYDILFGAQSAGYKIVNVSKSSATVTGSPNWGSISEIRVFSTSGPGGASQVDFDGIRIEDTDTVNPDYVMVAREVVDPPYAKESGQVQEIEFTLDVNIV